MRKFLLLSSLSALFSCHFPNNPSSSTSTQVELLPKQPEPIVQEEMEANDQERPKVIHLPDKKEESLEEER